MRGEGGSEARDDGFGRSFALFLGNLRRRRGDDFGFEEAVLSVGIKYAFYMVFGLAAGTLAVAPALADCGQDMQKLALARNNEMMKVNTFAKAGKGKPLDPASFCSISQGLLRAEDALIAYMVKNKDWCSFPDEAVNNLKTGHAKNAGFSAKACGVAAKIKKMKEQAAQGGGEGGGPPPVPLPAGPL
jgi:hypothetical protein